MQLTVKWSDDNKTVIVQTDQGGLGYISDNWPKQIRMEDMLEALFGQPQPDGTYTYHELDHRWLFQCLDTVSGFTKENIALIAMQDLSGLEEINADATPSRVAAASIAALLIERAFEVTRQRAIHVVLMNLTKIPAAA